MLARQSLWRTCLLFGMLLSAITAGMATIQVEVNGNPLTVSEPPMLVNDRTLVPLRGIFEALGAQVNWNASTRMITAHKGDTHIELGVGAHHATVNGKTVQLDVPAMISRGGSTMVPLRFISEALGANVRWNDATQTVSITSGT